MSDRFFLDPAVSSRQGDRATLRGDEAHHFGRVMRGKTGDVVVLFDGSGFSYRGEVVSVGKNDVSIRIVETRADTVESPLRLTVATAMPKGDRQGFLAEKLAELGVARLVPLRLERSVARAHDAAVVRLRRRVVEAAKQCGRNVLMDIAGETPFDRFVEQSDADAKFLLHPAALGRIGQKTPRDILQGDLPAEVAVLIGPEGSFTDREVEAARQNGFQPLELGARILRTETACIAAASLLLLYAG